MRQHHEPRRQCTDSSKIGRGRWRKTYHHVIFAHRAVRDDSGLIKRPDPTLVSWLRKGSINWGTGYLECTASQPHLLDSHHSQNLIMSSNTKTENQQPQLIAIATPSVLSSVATILLGLYLVFVFKGRSAFHWLERFHPWRKLPDNSLAAARQILKTTPVIVSCL